MTATTPFRSTKNPPLPMVFDNVGYIRSFVALEALYLVQYRIFELPTVLTGRKVKVHMPEKKELYVERRPQGDYAVRKPGSGRASAVTTTQGEAIERAKHINPGAAIHVERVRRTNCGQPDQWRKP
jgi:hypothetical protein